MNVIKKWAMQRGARLDARHGHDSVEDRVVGEQGPRPKLDPASNIEHAELARTLADRARIEELRDDVRRAEDGKVRHAPSSLYTTGLLLTVAIEAVGAILITRTLGVSPTERLPLALALAVALIGITAGVAHRTSVAFSSGTNGDSASGIGGVLQGAKRSLTTLVVLVSYSIVVSAIAIIRLRSSMDDDSSQLEIIAQALLMLTTSVGPAWCADWLVRRRAPAAAIEKELRLARRRLNDAEKKRALAETAVNRIARAGTAWDAEATRRRALYRTEHRLTTKEIT